MAKRVYAGRYAQAVFSIARERNELDRWQSDLEGIAHLVEDEVVISLLENPKLCFDDKARFLSARLSTISRLALNLVYLLISRGRLNIIGEIAGEYHRLLDSYRGVERARVVAAVPLGDDDRLMLERRLGAIVGKKVAVEPEVDSSLLGGIVVRIDGKLLDGSTRSRLEALKNEIARGRE